MNSEVKKPEFTKGDTDPSGDCGKFEAGIHHLTHDDNVMTPVGPGTNVDRPAHDWWQRIVVYGSSPEQAEALRDRVLFALKAQPSGVVHHNLIEALKFYANGDHLLLADPDDWDTCSGEPINFLHDDAGTASVEDGSIAKAALDSLNSYPVSAGGVDERAASEAWYLGHFYMGDKHCGLEWLSTEPCGGYRHQHPAEQWIVWQARAALSANHSEQVLEGWQLVPVEPTDAMLEAGDKYIGTPATYKAMLSACPSPAITKDFSQFLSAVMDAAGLIRHGRQSKELSEYLGMKCMEYRGAALSAPSHGEMARVLSDRQADSCNVDRDDQWKIYGQDFIDDVTAMLAAPAAPAADVWIPVSERLPDVPDGDEREVIVCVKRAHNGQSYSFSARYLNNFPLHSDSEDEPTFVTGWHDVKEHTEYDGWYSPLIDSSSGDEVTHWMPLPAAPAAPAADAGIVDMYRHLQKVTPYRFKKIQDASITDGGDVMYFHKDRFDAALLADMAAHCAAKGVV